MNPKIGSKRTPSMFFMNNFAIADLTMLLFRSLSVDLRINTSSVVNWKYGEYLCYVEMTVEVLVSGKSKKDFRHFWRSRFPAELLGPTVVLLTSICSVTG